MKSLGRSLANSSRSRSSRKFVVHHASCVHCCHTDSRQPGSQPDNQTGRQTDRHKHTEIWLIGVKFPSVWFVAGSWSNKYLWLLSWKFLWGLIRWILWHSASPGKEHHARLVQGLSNWAGLSSKSHLQTFVAFGVKGTLLASVFLCPVCSISSLGSSWEVGPIP